MLCALLGEGSFGKVREGIDIYTGKRVAIKAIHQHKLRRVTGAAEAVEREIRIMRQLSQSISRGVSRPDRVGGCIRGEEEEQLYIPKLYDVLQTRKVTYIVMERAFGTLESLMNCQMNRMLPQTTTRSVFRQLMLGIEWLHSKGVIHKDIKPANIMVSLSGTIKLADFGVSDRLSTYEPSNRCSGDKPAGTPKFQPPEIVNAAEFFDGPKYDVWSCGVTLYNMLTGRLPFDGAVLHQLFASIRSKDFSPDGIPDRCLPLLQGMLAKDPAARLAVHDILQHEWVGRMAPVEHDQDPLVWCLDNAAVVPCLSTHGFDDWQEPESDGAETVPFSAADGPHSPVTAFEVSDGGSWALGPDRAISRQSQISIAWTTTNTHRPGAWSWTSVVSPDGGGGGQRLLPDAGALASPTSFVRALHPTSRAEGRSGDRVVAEPSHGPGPVNRSPSSSSSVRIAARTSSVLRSGGRRSPHGIAFHHGLAPRTVVDTRGSPTPLPVTPTPLPTSPLTGTRMAGAFSTGAVRPGSAPVQPRPENGASQPARTLQSRDGAVGGAAFRRQDNAHTPDAMSDTSSCNMFFHSDPRGATPQIPSSPFRISTPKTPHSHNNRILASGFNLPPGVGSGSGVGGGHGGGGDGEPSSPLHISTPQSHTNCVRVGGGGGGGDIPRVETEIVQEAGLSRLDTDDAHQFHRNPIRRGASPHFKSELNLSWVDVVSVVETAHEEEGVPSDGQSSSVSTARPGHHAAVEEHEASAQGTFGTFPNSQAFHDQAAQCWVASRVEAAERQLLSTVCPGKVDVIALQGYLRGNQNLCNIQEPSVKQIIHNVTNGGCIHLSCYQFGQIKSCRPTSPSALGVVTCPITRSSSLLRFTYYLSLSNPGKDDAEESFEELDRGCMCICM